MDRTITMAHGAGGEVMMGLVKKVIIAGLADLAPESPVPLTSLEDGAVVGDMVFTTDAHTVSPLFFPGGDIGSLSVAGTVNDIAVMGADPIALSLALVIEEGFPIDELERIISGVRSACVEAGVGIVTGDTKVMEKGAIDGVVTCTSGIGRRHPALDANLAAVAEVREPPEWPSDAAVAEGDVILVSGTIGDHGTSILTTRETYGFEMDVPSDVAPLNALIGSALEAGGVVAMKDPTRGGVANALNEWSSKSSVGIMIDEASLPIRDDVRSVCDLLGIDPLEIGNEGKILLAVVPGRADSVLEAVRTSPHGSNATVIGHADASFEGVAMETTVGGRRYVDPPSGDPVPRIC